MADRTPAAADVLRTSLGSHCSGEKNYLSRPGTKMALRNQI